MKKYVNVTFFLFLQLVSAQNTKEIDSLIRVTLYEKSDSLKTVLYQKISKKYIPISFDSAYKYAVKSVDLAKKIAVKETIVESYIKLAWVYDDYSKLDLAISYYLKALKLAKEENNTTQLIRVYNHLGIAYFNKGNYDKSVRYLFNSLENAEKENDSVRASNAYNNIGYIFERQEKYDKALNFYIKSLKIRENMGSSANLFPALYNIASTSFRNNNFKQGENYLLKALAYCKKKKDTISIASSYSYLAVAYANENEMDKALSYLKQTSKLLPFVKDKYILGQIYYDFSAVYTKIGIFKQAEKYYFKSIELNKNTRIEYLESSYKELSELYRHHGQYKKALTFYHKYIHLKDSLYTLQKEKTISKIEKQYETAKKEQQINQLKSSIKQQNLFWFWVSALSILLAVLFIFFIYFYKKRSNELARKNQQINKALSEKEVLFKEVHHRVKNNLQVVSSILALQGRYLKDPNAIEAIKDSQNRISAISLIHQKLYVRESITAIRVEDYINDLVDNIIQTLKIDADKIIYTATIENLLLEVATVTPIGLILNELIINSIKHNLYKEKLKLHISLHKSEDDLVLIVTDNGKGLSEDFDYQKTDSYGMKLIASLSKKLKADLHFMNKNGLEVTLLIKKYKEIEN